MIIFVIQNKHDFGTGTQISQRCPPLIMHLTDVTKNKLTSLSCTFFISSHICSTPSGFKLALKDNKAFLQKVLKQACESFICNMLPNTLVFKSF